VQEESISSRQYSSNLNSRTKGFLWQGNSRVKGISFDKIVIFILLLIQFQLLMPFNVSDNFFLRLFTTDKVTYYLALIVILSQWSRGRIVIIRKIPGIWLLVLIICSMAITNYLATKTGYEVYANTDELRSVHLSALEGYLHKPSFWKQYMKEIGSILLMITTILVLNSYSKIYFFIKLHIYFVLFLSIISFLPIAAADILPETSQAMNIQDTISGQTTVLSYYTASVTERQHVLWIDANNYAFFLIPAILALVLLINYDSSIKYKFIYYLIFGFFILNLLLTQSRGGIFCLVISFGFLFYFYRKTIFKWIIPALIILTFIIFFVILAEKGNSILNLFDRLIFASRLFGGEESRYAVTGAESNRVMSAYFALQDIFEKPLMGWGSSFSVGASSDSGNHLGWLNIIGKYGLVGGTFIILFLIKYLRMLFKSLKYLKFEFFEKYLGYYILATYSTLILSGLFKMVSPIAIAPLAISFYLVSKYNTTRPEVS
jgi:hypothetical protein